MSDITYDGLRIQIEKPCECWSEGEEYTLEYYDCNKPSATSPDEIKLYRLNCDQDRIIGWINDTGNTVNVGSSDSGQIISRCVNNCDVTEIRRDVNSIKYENIIPVTTNGQKATLRCRGIDYGKLWLNFSSFEVCGPNISGQCVNSSGETIDLYYKGSSNPIEDINNNKTSKKAGLYSLTSATSSPFILYGAKNGGNFGNDIFPNCVTDTDSIFFLYVPCSFYDNINDYSLFGDTIRAGAFSGLTDLRGVYIEGRWSCQWSDTGPNAGPNGGPFKGCHNIEIVYCPDDFVEYFKRFSRIKYINGTPYYWDANERICKPYHTSCN